MGEKRVIAIARIVCPPQGKLPSYVVKMRVFDGEACSLRVAIDWAEGIAKDSNADLETLNLVLESD